MRSIEPGISRFRVWSYGPSRNDGLKRSLRRFAPRPSRRILRTRLYAPWRGAPASFPEALESSCCAPIPLRIDKHSRVEHALRIEFSFDRPQCRRKQRRTLTIVPGPVIAADRVMMGDRTARLD